MPSTILGMGQWLPETIRDNSAWPDDFGRGDSAAQGRELTQIEGRHQDRYEEILFRRSAADESDPFRGCVRRRVADAGMMSSKAEALAAEAALADAGVDPGDVDFVLQSAMVPDRLSPSNAPRVAQLIGAHRAAGIEVEAACASAVVQLNMAAALIESGRARTVVAVQSHLMNRANPLSHPASPMLGDAATAIVVGAGDKPGFVAAKIATDGAFYDAVTWARGREIDPPWWLEGGPLVAGTLDPELTKRLGRSWVRMAAVTVGEVLRETRTEAASVDVIASVQPRKWLPGAICEAFGLPDDRAPLTHAELAHIGACGVVTNLIEARRRGQLRPGAKVVLFGMGAGLTRASALIDWTAG